MTRDYEVILAVGTSTLGWMRRLDAAVRFPEGWLPGAPTVDQSPDATLWRHNLREHLSDGRANAELDSLHSLIQRKRIEAADVRRVHLLVSDTDAARWVADVLKYLIPKSLGTDVRTLTHGIAGLSPSDARMASGDAMKNLVRVGAACIKRARESGREPIINATPGFKAESALLLLVGALLGVEVSYLYEDERALLFPPLPIAWDPGTVTEDFRKLLARLGSGIADEDLAQEIASATDGRALWPFLETIAVDGQQVYGTSAFGELLLQTIPTVLEEPPARTENSCEKKLAAKEAGHRPEDVLDLAEEICRLPFVTRVYEQGWQKDRGQHHQVGLLLGRAGDAEDGIIRLRLRSKYGMLIRFVVYTTASNREQWLMARSRAADAFKRVDPAEELIEEMAERLDAAGAEAPSDEPVAQSIERVRQMVLAIQPELQRFWDNTSATEASSDEGYERLDTLWVALARLAQLEWENANQQSRVETLASELADVRTAATSRKKQLDRASRRMEDLETQLKAAESERDELATELELASRPYRLVQLVPGAESPPFDVRIEVTEPALAAAGVLHLDHHGPGTSAQTPAACEQAAALPEEQLPPSEAVLATLRPDPDSIAAIAVLRARRQGHDFNRELIAEIGRIDRLGPRADAGLGLLRDAVVAISRVAFDEQRTLEERVQFVQDVLEGKVSAKKLARLRSKRDKELDAARSRARVEEVVPSRLALVESSDPFALRFGYEKADTVVACHPSFSRDGDNAIKFTIARWGNHTPTDIPAIAQALNRLEAERRGIAVEKLASLWDGHDSIIGSPQSEATMLSVDDVLAVVREHLR